LCDRAVQEYKASKEYAGIWSGTLAICLTFGSFCLFCGLFMGGMVGGGPGSTEVWTPMHYARNTIFAILAIADAITFCVLAFGKEAWGAGDRKIRAWRAIPLSAYQGTIPEYVLAKAVSIAEAIPAARFYIEQLVSTTEHNAFAKMEPDPFLIVEYSDERYYIEVWDEKDFETQL
jgi:hypothetical protein